jgi:hypothetical protein
MGVISHTGTAHLWRAATIGASLHRAWFVTNLRAESAFGSARGGVMSASLDFSKSLRLTASR